MSDIMFRKRNLIYIILHRPIDIMVKVSKFFIYPLGIFKLIGYAY